MNVLIWGFEMGKTPYTIARIGTMVTAPYMREMTIGGIMSVPIVRQLSIHLAVVYKHYFWMFADCHVRRPWFQIVVIVMGFRR
jgi:hypothetical protein